MVLQAKQQQQSEEKAAREARKRMEEPKAATAEIEKKIAKLKSNK